MSKFIPPDKFIVYETEHWWINHRCDTVYPGYLMIGAKNPEGESLSDLCRNAQNELGPLLARSTELLGQRLGAIRVYEGRYGHQPGHTVHYHVIPVYEWTIAAYWKDERYRTLMQFYGQMPDTFDPECFDGADMTLFIWRTYAEPAVTPPSMNTLRVSQVVDLLRKAFAEMQNAE